jgi:hypothetical protein
MNALVTLLLIGIALFSVLLVMYVVGKEQRGHDDHLSYQRSPWPNEPELPAAKTDAEALAEPITVPDEPGNHAPVTEDAPPEATNPEA